MWNVIAENLAERNLSMSANFAFFDHELAAVNSFSKTFKITTKMCSYHVKSNLNKKIYNFKF